ncbi:hypothetical protein BFS35_003020 [Macrococcoides goetzii]|uniref:Uncharacterized protein n=1 Tax=Macrococcoides goetzii TaxID=1891097 RepID=A0A2G5NSH3_9STAP|nr:hypothetical protein [Macrococcus goetzii]RAI82673.1 hypothetical protein BFS35_003020 [Macrococcus goetzii]
MYICPVCGYNQLEEEPYKFFDDNIFNASFEICSCCGFQFGFDDDNIASQHKQKITLKEAHKIYFDNWEKNGYKIFSKIKFGDRILTDYLPLKILEIQKENIMINNDDYNQFIF